MESTRTCEITGCERPAKPSSINGYCDRHAGLVPWLGASAAMGAVTVAGSLVIAVALLLIAALS